LSNKKQLELRRKDRASALAWPCCSLRAYGHVCTDLGRSQRLALARFSRPSVTVGGPLLPHWLCTKISSKKAVFNGLAPSSPHSRWDTNESIDHGSDSGKNRMSGAGGISLRIRQYDFYCRTNDKSPASQQPVEGYHGRPKAAVLQHQVKQVLSDVLGEDLRKRGKTRGTQVQQSSATRRGLAIFRHRCVSANRIDS